MPRLSTARLFRLVGFVTLPALLVFSAASIADAAEFAVGSPARSELTLRLGSSKAISQSAAGMKPGDSIMTPLVVRNSGSGQLRYSMSAASDDLDGKGLGAILLMSVESRGWAGEAASCEVPGGSAIFGGRLAGGGFGDAAIGPDDGDRLLASGAQELLCIRTTMPLSGGNAYQGATATITFTLSSEPTPTHP
jgi:hypothetical protein